MLDLDLDALRAQPLVREPFQHLIVPRFIRHDALERINVDYPRIHQRGSFPATQLAYGPAFKGFLGELESDAFCQAMEDKFELGLKGRPTTTTVRGWCGPGDGKIHTDSAGKIITVLIYMNSVWEASGGRLRLLRSRHDINDVIVEVPPIEGTLLAFRRAGNSWHGHEPFVGERRVIQFNWVISAQDRRIVLLRHHLSASLKRMLATLMPSRH